jgi:dephospho-CoA kinase
MQESGQRKPYILGLTGGIGSGKTTISNIFKELGVEIIDADEISRTLVLKDTLLFKNIVKHFGNHILNKAGELDRSALRQIIFNAPKEKQWLEEILHPAIQTEIQRQIIESTSAYVVLVVPLLLESGNYNFVDRVLVIDVPETLQIERIKQRDSSNEELVKNIIAAQISRQERLSQADDIIDNSGSLSLIRDQVKKLHAKYLQESKTDA